MKIKPRTSPPSGSNLWYIHTSKKGYNKCIIISGKSCLANCVGFCYGRYMEMTGKKKCKLSVNNAEDWFAQAKDKGIPTGSKPKVGAIICWRKGKVKNSGDGCGHVAMVEKVYDNGNILISESGYGSSKRMWTETLKPPYSLAGYTLQGFIYNPDVDNVITTTKVTLKEGKTYKVTTSSGLNVRKSPKSSAKKVSGVACGDKVECLEVKKNWIRIGKDKWICAYEGSTYYIG